MVLKSPDSASPMAYTRKGPVPDMVHVTPVKHTVTAAAVEPLTPTANLKMLISAASPDIRDREMKKVLFRPIENEELKPATPESPTEDEEKDDSCQVRENKAAIANELVLCNNGGRMRQQKYNCCSLHNKPKFQSQIGFLLKMTHFNQPWLKKNNLNHTNHTNLNVVKIRI